MQPTDAEVTINLAPEEAEALEKALRIITFNTGAPELKLWCGIQAKLKAAQENAASWNHE